VHAQFTESAATLGSTETTDIIYINGINTLPGQLATTRGLLANVLKTYASELDSSSIVLTSWYNRTREVQLSDYLKSRMPCINSITRWVGTRSPPSQLDDYQRCLARQDTLNYRAARADLAEAIAQLKEIESNQLPEEAEDADSLSQYLTRRRRGLGHHIVMVPHSQGNLMAEQALQLMRARHTYSPASDSLCIGVVTVAAPTSAGWDTLVDNYHLAGLISPLDILGQLGKNHFTLVSTPLSDAANLRMQGALGAKAFAAAVFGAESDGLAIHSINSNYLKYPQTARAIAQDVAQIQRECTVGSIAITPAAGPDGVHVPVGSSLQLGVVLTNRNGRPLAPNRGILWQWDTPVISFDTHTLIATVIDFGSGQVTASVGGHIAGLEFNLPTSP
jgi:hypothetical protein